ncbi:nuclear exosome regulator NRDE2 [Adelges cooleyi]|uniref:nuclear exosome regulator NRDE2 n=1 Tax=Adelges cooleyi TaxID=133065 RepID=UPI00217F824B|nr:nuclear exosome regulator NRDE2 [Adelges cooleyi]
MSLFPAYLDSSASKSNVDLEKNDEDVATPSKWLTNSSFEPEATKLVNKRIDDEKKESEDTNVEHLYKLYKKRHGKKKKKKEKKNISKFIRTKELAQHIVAECDFVSFDRKPELGNLKVDKLYRPAAPMFHFTKYKYLDHHGWVYTSSKQKKYKRYYSYKEKYYGDTCLESHACDDDLKMNKLMLINTKQVDEEALRKIESSSIKCENSTTPNTADYNKKLSEHPHDINLWVNFINFQDSSHNFSRDYGYKAIANRNSIMEKKLAILDKAISLNPDSEILLNKRWTIASELLTTDQLKEELLKELKNCRSANTVLWNYYINAIQSSLSDCNTFDVLKSYSDAMLAISKIKHGLPIEQKLEIEKQTIELFVKCGLFLRQAGHYEQLLTLINMYLTVSIKHFDGNLMEKFYTESTDDILFSEELKSMPVHKAWYQVETLRTVDHWMPLPKHMADTADDPQRVVLPEDVSELVQPITMHRSIITNLVFACCILLKIPILPSRNFVFRQLGIDNCHFNLDSLETVLSSVFMAHHFQNCNYSSDRVSNVLLVMLKAAMPPHYYDNESTSSKTYFSLITSILRHITDCLYAMDYTTEANMFLVWWLRFERYRIVIKSSTDNSHLVSEVKCLLQKPQYRNNIPLFIEFALLKSQVGKIDDALKILQKLVDAQPVLLDNKPIYENYTYRASFTAIYKNITEIMIQSDNSDKAIKILLALATGVLPGNGSLNDLEQANSTFNNVTERCLDDHDQFSHSNLEYNYLPQFFIEWVVCHSWFLYLTQNVRSAVVMLKRVVDRIGDIIKMNTFQTQHAAEEILNETLVIILNHHCNKSKTGHKDLRKHLRYAISKYPQNMQFLFSMVWNEVKTGGFGTPLWQIENVYIDHDVAENTDAVRLMLILVGRERLRMSSELAKKNVTNYQSSMCQYGAGNDIDLFKNMHHLFDFFIRNLCNIKEIKKCPMFWRLFLQYIAENAPLDYKKYFYEAVENCPWHKFIYLEAAFYLPEELTNICDILVEKQLRIHITHEELLVLRED